MKYVILVPDGMADYPEETLGNRTPLEAAETPNMDAIVQQGILGQVKTIPLGMTPASDVANMSLFGFDPKRYYSGRGPLEAANLGVTLAEDDIAFRCNLITSHDDILTDYSAGHISNKESEVLIEYLNKVLGEEGAFYAGISYRHLFVIEDRGRGFDQVSCVPPHDILNQSIPKNLPKGKNAKVLIDLMMRSQKELAAHEINHVRVDLGENPASMIWLWGQGRKPTLPLYIDHFHKTGAVISAVDLIKGLGRILGLDVINVPGATGYYNTDYQAKAQYGIKALQGKDFVYLHVEAPDEAGHNGDLREKITAIERFDNFIVGGFLKHFGQTREDFRVLVVPDHATPLSMRTHTSDVVCFALSGRGVDHNGFDAFSEQKAKASTVRFASGVDLIEYFYKE